MTGFDVGSHAPQDDNRDGSAAAPGWYPDPHEPGSLRYFDGQVWTEHRHQEDGKLPAIGSWLSSTFSVVAENFVPAVLLSLGLQLVGSVMLWVLVQWAVGDLAIEDERLINLDIVEIVAFGAMVVVAALWRGISNIARDRFMQRAHMQAQPSIADALRRAVIRLPKWISIYLLIAAAWLIAVFGLALILVVAGAGAAALLAVLLFGFAVWIWVRLAFVSAAVAAAPARHSAVASSFGVSRGRFWAVFGRLVLVLVGLAVVGQLAGWMSQGVTASVDNNALAERVTFETTDTELVVNVADFALADVLPSLQSFLLFGSIAGVIGSLLALVASSAMMRLYLEAGGDSDVVAGSAG